VGLSADHGCAQGQLREGVLRFMATAFAHPFGVRGTRGPLFMATVWVHLVGVRGALVHGDSVGPPSRREGALYSPRRQCVSTLSA